MPEVSIVIVNMNCPDILIPCLDSIKAYTKVSYETLVVAYMYTTENLLRLKEQYPWVTIVESNELRGFSENNNLALRQARGKYCFVVNDDTWMEMPVIDTLVSDFEKLPDNLAAVSPKIVFPNGKVQTCGRAPWTAWRYMLHYLHMVDETHPSKWSMKEGLFQTWTLNGACFMAKTTAFRAVGWFDERYTFTPEDIALGHIFNEKGYTVYADSDVAIIHLANATASHIELAIKPTRVCGALLFYCGENCFLHNLLASYVWLVEEVRIIKYSVIGHKSGRNKLMYDIAQNVQWAVWSGKEPKEIFVELYSRVRSL